MDHTERDATDNCSDVPSTRETLGGHLYQKVSELCEGRGASPDLLEKLTGMLMECGTTDMLLLLRDKQHLQVRLAAAIQTLSSADNIDEKGFAFYNDSDHIHNLGVQLFAKVSEIESGLCAQITGMLLELDPKGVELLLKDEEKLRRAVEKSKSTFLEHHNYTNGNGVSGQPSNGDDIHTSGERTIPETDDMLDIGERLHETVTAVYPESAAQITGMLLEMNSKMLKLLMQDEGLLWKKIEIAREVLNQQEKT